MKLTLAQYFLFEMLPLTTEFIWVSSMCVYYCPSSFPLFNPGDHTVFSISWALNYTFS